MRPGLRQWWLFLVLLAALAAALWRIWPEPSRRRARLPDGREVRLVRVSYGLRHRIVQGPLLPRLGAGVLPAAWLWRLGVQSAEFTNAAPTLAVWVQWQGPGLDGADLTDAAVSDAGGIECEPLRFCATLFGGKAPSGRTLRAWQFTHFPRRSRTLTLRLYSRGNTWQPSRQAEFQLANPAPRPPPGWTAPALPVAQRVGDHEFVLTRFDTGVSVSGPLAWGTWIAPWNRADFQVRTRGQPDTAWTVTGLELRDATGNWFTPARSPLVSNTAPITVWFPAALWAGEPAWRLQVEFARTGGFAANELGAVPAVTVPEPGQSTRIEARVEVPGFTLLVRRLERWTMTAGARPHERMNADLWVQVLPPTGARPVLVRATDDRGRPVPANAVLAQGGGSYSFRLWIQPDARAVDFTFALPRTHTVAFTAAPQR